MSCTFPILLLTGVMADAAILRLSCWWYNDWVGGPVSPRSVPNLEMGKAVGITVVNLLVGIVAGFLLGLAVVAATANAGPGSPGAEAIGFVTGVPIGILIKACVLAGMLPTPFRRALGVTLLGLVITIAFGIVCVAVILLVVVGLTGMAR